MADRASHIMGGKGKSKPAGKKGPVHRVHIKRGHGGGFIVQNDHEQTDPNDPNSGGSTETPVMGMDQLKQHLDDTMGDQPAVPAPPPPAAAQAGPAMPPQQ